MTWAGGRSWLIQLGKSERGGAEEAIHVIVVGSGSGSGSGPGNIMHMKLAIKSRPEETLTNFPHQSKIKGLI